MIWLSFFFAHAASSERFQEIHPDIGGGRPYFVPSIWNRQDLPPLGQPLPRNLQNVMLSKAEVEPQYKSVLEDKRCVDEDAKLTRGKVKMAGQCQARCSSDPQCSHYAFWKLKKYCETYSKCFFVEADGNNKITIYKRLTECDTMLTPYMGLISEQFPFKAVIAFGEKKNMSCKCTMERWIVCGIFAIPNGVVDTVVQKRLDPSQDEETLSPFQIVTSTVGMDHSALCFVPPTAPIIIDSLGNRKPPIGAEINLLPPNKCINFFQCLDGTPAVPELYSKEGFCPFLREPFRALDPVYILKSERSRAEAGHPIACISSSGLRSWSIQNAGKNFIDPFHREGGRAMNMRNDYELYFIFDEEHIKRGLCGGHEMQGFSSHGSITTTGPPTPSPAENKKTQKRRARKAKKAEEASEAIDSIAARSPRLVSPSVTSALETLNQIPMPTQEDSGTVPVPDAAPMPTREDSGTVPVPDAAPMPTREDSGTVPVPDAAPMPTREDSGTVLVPDVAPEPDEPQRRQEVPFENFGSPKSSSEAGGSSGFHQNIAMEDLEKGDWEEVGRKSKRRGGIGGGDSSGSASPPLSAKAQGKLPMGAKASSLQPQYKSPTPQYQSPTPAGKMHANDRPLRIIQTSKESEKFPPPQDAQESPPLQPAESSKKGKKKQGVSTSKESERVSPPQDAQEFPPLQPPESSNKGKKKHGASKSQGERKTLNLPPGLSPNVQKGSGSSSAARDDGQQGSNVDAAQAPPEPVQEGSTIPRKSYVAAASSDEAIPSLQTLSLSDAPTIPVEPNTEEHQPPQMPPNLNPSTQQTSLTSSATPPGTMSQAVQAIANTADASTNTGANALKDYAKRSGTVGRSALPRQTWRIQTLDPPKPSKEEHISATKTSFFNSFSFVPFIIFIIAIFNIIHKFSHPPNDNVYIEF